MSDIILDTQPPEIVQTDNPIQVIEADGLVIAPDPQAVDITSTSDEQIVQATQAQVDTVASKEVLLIEQPELAIALGNLSGEIKEARFDTVGVFVYVGVALSKGIADTAAAWRIRRIDNSVPQSPTLASAGGLDRFAFSWANHLSEAYA